ncbi:MAG: acyl-CoA dehydrogenase [Acidimicrobiales bacterium]|nr:acyl-CoA dehydrogenase [Acidimicrobiales bacterium]
MALSPEQQLLVDTVARLVADHPVAPPPPDEVLAVDEGAQRALVEAGLWAMRAPAALGGAGAGVLDTALVLEGLARGPIPVPFLGTQLALEVLAPHAATQPDVVRSLVAGGTGALIVSEDLAAVADTGLAVDWRPGAVAVGRGDAGVVVSATAGETIAIADLTRRAATVSTTDRLEPLADAAAVGRTDAAALVFVAADLVGTMAGALDAAVAHACDRHQFGRPVGSFQAVQHLCADQLVSIEAARSATWHAAALLDAGAAPDAALAAARVAKAWASSVARQVTEAAIQVWGGLGMTWECPAHLYLRRALVGRALLGDEHVQHARLAATPVAAADEIDEAAEPADQAAFRRELRRWLDEHAPRAPAPTRGPERAAFWGAWHRSLFAGGWMGVSWPTEVGGRGLLAVYEAIVNDEVGAAGAPPMPHVGFLGRALLHAGTPAQQQRFLRPLLDGTEVWCQGFSEPDAGSDLAALRCRAVRDGDAWVVDGQKVWTSDAAWADWCLLLVRTDPDAPKHQGISALLVDMASPGIDVRPITQINGDTEFNEVFFTGVRVPVDQLLGAPGDGWRIAMTTVGYERGPADVGFSSRYARLAAELRAAVDAEPTDDVRRRAVVEAEVAVAVLRAHVARSLAARGEAPPGAEGSVDKLLAARVEQLLHHVALDLHAAPLVGRADDVLGEYLYSRAATIAGGTAQIQRTIVAERLLGMPRG